MAASTHDAAAFRQAVEAEPLPETLPALLDQAAARHPDRTIWNFFERNESYTYREAQERVARAANALRALGVRKGSHVGIMSPNVGAFPITWLALGRLGAVAVALNTRYTPREVDYVLRDSDADFFIVHESLRSIYEAIPDKSPRLSRDRIVVIEGAGSGYKVWEDLVTAASPEFVPQDSVQCDDVLNIQYTSGTSGFPKGCLLTHRYWLTMGKSHSAITEMPIERALYNQNFFYLDGPCIATMCMFLGATFFFASRPSAAKFVEWARTHRIQYLFFFEVLYKQPETPDDGKNELKMIHIFGLNKKYHADLERRFALIARESYGMTEAGCITYMPVADVHMVGSGSCGIPAPWREVKIAGDDGTPVARGEIGELWVRGPGMMLGYYKKPEANAESLRDGWFLTGDLLRQDEDGYYTIVGRKKDMIRRNAENVAAREVEAVLRGLPQVKEAAVVPVPDERVGEEIKAYLQLQPGLGRDDLPPQRVIEHCKANLASFKIPRYIAFAETFPMTDSDRVEKKKLIAGVPDLTRDSYDRVDNIWR
ncbi:MAG: class I adenylate-forming enzyme family protein [Alphaproteobacteria bacterium]|nr:class I adenylate-forming enzyme family protein [Alphaproteobacteria bacterium]